jgi:predicted DNA-binding WGR domain protein
VLLNVSGEQEPQEANFWMLEVQVQGSGRRVLRGWGGVGEGAEKTQTLYAHMNKKKIFLNF